MEPELTCVGPSNKSEGLGELTGGYVFSVSLAYARRLLAPRCAILNALGPRVPYEIAVGLNGRVWVKAETVRRTLLVFHAIRAAERAAGPQARALADRIVSQMEA